MSDSAMLEKLRKRRASRTTLRSREQTLGYAFISPWILGFLAFTVFPIVASLYFSFTRYAVVDTPQWVGLRNFREALFQDSIFWKSLYNTLYYTVVSVPLHLVISMVVAMLLNTKIRGVHAYRVVYYLPSVVPGVAAAMLWGLMLNPRAGLINMMLGFLGIDGPNWLASATWSKPALILMSLWSVGGSMVIYLAGLQGIPQHLYEAADIDGAGWWGKLRFVTIPMMTPTIFFNLVMGIINSFQVFTSAYILTGGGPRNSTTFYMLHLYGYAFEKFRMGYASALAWVLFWVLAALSALVVRSSAAWVYYEGELG